MNETVSTETNKTPWHIWVVGILTLLWNGSGTYTFLMAQSGRLSGLSAEEEAYYAAQPLWFAVSTDIALLTAVAAGIALLLRSRMAFQLFAVSLIFIVLNNLYELVSGASRMLVNQGAIVLTTVVLVIAALQFTYSWTMSKRGTLK
jgi:hypothetical protein